MLGHGRSLENYNIRHIYAIIIIQIPSCMNGACTLKIHQQYRDFNVPLQLYGKKEGIERTVDLFSWLVYRCDQSNEKNNITCVCNPSSIIGSPIDNMAFEIRLID